MKKLLLLIALASFVYAGCGNKESAKDKALKKEILTNDSVANELEKSKKELEKSVDEMEKTVNKL